MFDSNSFINGIYGQAAKYRMWANGPTAQKKVRAGFTKNNGRPRNRVRARMARQSRRINRNN